MGVGLFDYVYAPLKCRHCGYEEKEHEWQTKAIENILTGFEAAFTAEKLQFSTGTSRSTQPVRNVKRV
ncbi:hypothetical protein DRP05_14935 [Archaeoglobales archaeon]|nr:MAG: hypothetical protein DRP05_14935 [Archaeoglobales archaeon]